MLDREFCGHFRSSCSISHRATLAGKFDKVTFQVRIHGTVRHTHIRLPVKIVNDNLLPRRAIIAIEREAPAPPVGLRRIKIWHRKLPPGRVFLGNAFVCDTQRFLDLCAPPRFDLLSQAAESVFDRRKRLARRPASAKISPHRVLAIRRLNTEANHGRVIDDDPQILLFRWNGLVTSLGI